MLGLRPKNLIAATAAAITLLGAVMKPSYADDGRLHVALIKSRAVINGSGSLFYQGHRYRINVDGIDASKFKSARIDLVGTATNLQSPSDILGPYVVAESDSAVTRAAHLARLKNTKGVFVELHGANTGKLVLDLGGLTITGRGWPSQKSIK